MAGNISKILAKYLKSSVSERDEYFLSLCDAFSKVIGNVSKGSIVELVECCLCLSHVFFISVVYILRDHGQNYLFF